LSLRAEANPEQPKAGRGSVNAAIKGTRDDGNRRGTTSRAMVKAADFSPRFARKNPQLRHLEVMPVCPEYICVVK